jgi:hypothetical protein
VLLLCSVVREMWMRNTIGVVWTIELLSMGACHAHVYDPDPARPA